MIHALHHPLVQTLVNHLRHHHTDALRFRHTVKELTKILLYEALESSSMISQSIPTWQGEQMFDVMDEEEYLVVTVLLAGMPMLEAVAEVLPKISSGFLAMRRDEVTHESTLFYDRLPACEGTHVILVDVMLATGRSLIDALVLLKSRGVKQITCLNVIASPEGLKRIEEEHPDVSLYVAQVDEKLDVNKYIIPGLGDAGDREYNTPE
jgi:uracil phosphoribosyltransferase